MEYAKKMALIEPRLLESLQQQQQQQSCHDHQPQGIATRKTVSNWIKLCNRYWTGEISLKKRN